MQKSSLINSIATMLVAFAPFASLNGCGIFVLGEPKLPKSMIKK